MAMFTPVETKRAYDIVYDQIENMILSGELKPGDKLPSERELMTIYKRSHPTIREALRMLEVANYIHVIPGSRAEVCFTGTETIQEPLSELIQFQQVPLIDIYHFICLTEPEFLRESAQHFTWENMVELERLQSDMQNQITDPAAYSAYMFTFHMELMKATHNPLVFIFWKGMGSFWGRDVFSACQDAVHIDDIHALQKAHEHLLEAINKRDAARAAQLASECWLHWQLTDVGKGGGTYER